MTKRSVPLTADRVREVGVEPAFPPMLEKLDPDLRADALLFLLKTATSEDGPLDPGVRIVLDGFFFGVGQQTARFAEIREELAKAGISASETTPKNQLAPALEAFARYTGSTPAADLLAERFVGERSGIESDEEDASGPTAGRDVTLAALSPAESHGLSGVMATARESVGFCGITAGGSVGTDAFRNVLRESPGISFRFLLLDPDSQAFIARAEEEDEPHEVWRFTLSATLHRLRAYRENLGATIEARVTSAHPSWRLMLVDDEVAYVNSYPAGKRGTESTQYVIPRTAPELVNGFRAHFSSLWEVATPVDLAAKDGPLIARASAEAG